MTEYPEPVGLLYDAVMSLPGVIECFPTPHSLEDITPEIARLPGEHSDLPQVAIARTDGGRPDEVLLQIEIRLDRSDDAWLTVEFLAWWVRDQARGGKVVQMRPLALPPRAYDIQLGRTLRFVIEHFHINEGEPLETTMKVAAGMASSLTSNYQQYQDCFADPATYVPEDETEVTLEQLVEMAEGGNTDAQFALGEALAFGEDVEQDAVGAVRWFTEAANAGHIQANYMLGYCYQHGSGVETDFVKAQELYVVAADGGMGIAAGSIGDMYAEGQGVEKNHEKAFEWFEKGMELGEIACYANMGDCYEFGNGVAKDLAKALEIYEECIEAGFNPVGEAIDRVKPQFGLED